jgi:cell division protein FtsZ
MVMEIENKPSLAKIKVIGVGGAGGNAVNRMVASGFDGVEFISINTDALALENSLAEHKISIGNVTTSGLGAGARPQVGQDAILESRTEVVEALQGADMVFITAGMGGGTGTGAAPVVAEICRELGILSVGVVTKPFLFEGPVRMKNCRLGLNELMDHVDTIITIPNQKILSIADRNMSFKQAFAICDDVLTDAVRGISDIILRHGEIQVDFADVNAVMKNGGAALMGTGTAEGENRAVVAAERAINSPLLDDISISGASGLLVNITGGNDLGMMEINDAMSFIFESVGEENEPNIIFGTAINESQEGKLSVTVIATGFDQGGQPTIVPKTAIKEQPSQIFAKPAVKSAFSSMSEKSILEPIAEMKPQPVKFKTPTVKNQYAERSIEAPTELSNPENIRPAMTRLSDEQSRFSGNDMDVRSAEVEETILPSSNSAANFFHTTQPQPIIKPVQESPSSFVEEEGESDVDYETPAFLRNQDF